MIRVVARLVVAEENVEEFLAVTRELIEATREKDGPVSYTLVRSVKDPAEYRILEVWDEMATLSAHAKSDHFRAALPKLGALVLEAPPAEIYEDII